MCSSGLTQEKQKSEMGFCFCCWLFLWLTGWLGRFGGRVGGLGRVFFFFFWGGEGVCLVYNTSVKLQLHEYI